MNLSLPLSDIDKFNLWNETDFKALPEYKIKIKTYANNTVDMIMQKCNFKGFEKERFYGDTTTYPKMKSDEDKEQDKIDNLERSARRARSAVHALVRSMGADHMLTLTTRDCIGDVKSFDSIFQEFIRLVRNKDFSPRTGLTTRKDIRKWAYVAVRELQERGALHMHIACVGKQDLALLRACWYVALGGNFDDKGEAVLGAIDVQSNRKKFSGETEFFKTNKLVGYLTKYISKTFESSPELGQRRYKASRHIPKVNIQKQYLQATFSYGHAPFLAALNEMISIANFEGVDTDSLDYELWNKGLELCILRAEIKF